MNISHRIKFRFLEFFISIFKRMMDSQILESNFTRFLPYFGQVLFTIQGHYIIL